MDPAAPLAEHLEFPFWDIEYFYGNGRYFFIRNSTFRIEVCCSSIFSDFQTQLFVTQYSIRGGVPPPLPLNRMLPHTAKTNNEQVRIFRKNFC